MASSLLSIAIGLVLPGDCNRVRRITKAIFIIGNKLKLVLRVGAHALSRRPQC